MTGFQFRTANLAVLLVSSSGAIAHAAGIQVPFEGLPAIELSFDAGGSAPEWRLEAHTAADARYSWQGHSLSLKIEERSHARLLRFKLEAPSGQELSVRGYKALVRLPLEGLHSITAPATAPIAHTLIYYHEHKKWPENMRIYRAHIPDGFKESGNANHEAPLIQIAGQRGENRIAAGWTVSDRGTELKGDADADRYVLTLSRQNDVPFTGASLEDALFIDTSGESWWDVLRSYARTFDQLNHRRHETAPAWTTEPVFCTWYCYLDHIDQAGVLKIARKCKEMGFGTILIDAGWDCRSDGGFGDFENGILGDFKAMPDRFNDLPGAIQEMHKMGLRVELWSAPFWQGRKSKAYQEKTGQWHAWSSEGENHNLCPRHPGMPEYLRETFARVARTYGMDGMWLDAADGVPATCEARHPHIPQPMGAAFTDCLAAIRDGLRSVNPEAITEARVLHANLQSKRALDVVQPSDAPESYENLRLASIQMRSWAYDVVLKNDPMFWAKEASTTQVGKFLATMVCNGVPALSVDFLTAPPEQCAMVAAWLDFYKQHKQTLLHGDFSVFGADYGAPDMMLAGKDEAVVYLHNPATRDVVLPRPVRRVILLNCTETDDLTLNITPHGRQHRVQSYSPAWSRQGESTIVEIRDESPVRYRVLQGAATVIEIE